MRPYPKVQDLEHHSGITWHQLVELESRLAKLLWEARQASVTCRCWADAERAFLPIRTALAELVGFPGKNRRHPVLGRPEAYHVAYWKLFYAVAGLMPGRAGGMEKAAERQRIEPTAEACSAEPENTTVRRI
jgi:hypothetical protein